MHRNRNSVEEEFSRNKLGLAHFRQQKAHSMEVVTLSFSHLALVHFKYLIFLSIKVFQYFSTWEDKNSQKEVAHLILAWICILKCNIVSVLEPDFDILLGKWKFWSLQIVLEMLWKYKCIAMRPFYFHMCPLPQESRCFLYLVWCRNSLEIVFETYPYLVICSSWRNTWEWQ